MNRLGSPVAGWCRRGVLFGGLTVVPRQLPRIHRRGARRNRDGPSRWFDADTETDRPSKPTVVTGNGRDAQRARCPCVPV